jgi:hypothetical protein
LTKEPLIYDTDSSPPLYRILLENSNEEKATLLNNESQSKQQEPMIGNVIDPGLLYLLNVE